MLKDKRVSSSIFIVGAVVLLISIILPSNILNSLTNHKPIGLSTIYICPVIGIFGIIFSVKEKSWLFGMLNLMLVFSFPITMAIGYLLNHIIYSFQ